MTERQLQFRVGLFVIVSIGAVVAMVFHFGEIADLWRPKYPLVVHFESAPGVYPGTPVRRNGIAIGTVKEVMFDEQRGGVLAVLSIDGKNRLRRDAEPHIVRSLLGDATIDFTPGSSPDLLADGDLLEGVAPAEPMEIVARMEENATDSLRVLTETGREWQKVGQQLNGLMETNRGRLDEVVERTAVALEEFSETMRATQVTLASANRVLGDPAAQEALRKTLAALPGMVDETRLAIQAARGAVGQAEVNLANLEQATRPLGDRTASIALRLDNTLANLESVSAEFNRLAQAAAQEDGSLNRFLSDPTLYRNLNQSVETLAVLLRNVEPITRDFRIFSDRIARHPELLGISGAILPSSGIKEPARIPAPQQPPQPIPQPANPPSPFNRN
jgi:phospholipid/cholesterol/gamma-HCH transport system substrate-binding protein